jgi:hypothetical protein
MGCAQGVAFGRRAFKCAVDGAGSSRSICVSGAKIGVFVIGIALKSRNLRAIVPVQRRIPQTLKNPAASYHETPA